ncbi:methylmalonyl-CoA mutase C-terminal domain-containing protein/methyltransferase cognate corrinoid proteins [Candidatus Frackibacter sp. WG12]|uniref:corrinoid protein n=1 Tax=unclassified Candidatus Frackibacter TaxID=2648818 RepID=UPI000796F72D|nr:MULTISPECIES: corrinoid protein [unclassified Candidatus Frackibacter]KXS41067.1 MAG: methyltransferase cognate corrinoid protein [Candidatus Frackibacter sp. T328-2]SDC12844.1 methylmalonyl-CoA mutase C-terminal domain-containing protein/methyltransferase cognate corrinoid proteins [Candidatus Frackibacter sp. WG11]SEM35628.1 methylmalonyl-CoA mutase C-terminal domain-containing protein/methyltransferase cognate corrinoid proteins [Candidatus Frackibacter sp. WG12]
MSKFEEIAEAVISGEVEKVGELAQDLVDEGVKPSEIIKEGLVAGMDVVGARFKANEMFVPEVLISAKSMHAGMDVVKPLLAEGESSSAGTVVIGTVEGDLHDIGKNLVAMMLEGAGFEVVDLGVDLSAEEFVDAVKEHNPEVLGLSALLTTTMPAMQNTIEALEEAGVRDQVKIMVGGAPVTEDFANEIGADAYASDGSASTELAREFVGA